jgi:hypothetical protein
MKEAPAMRVVLLYPEVYDMARFKDKRKEFPPFGLLYLAAVIEQAGHHITVEAVTPSRTCLDLRGYDAAGFSLASSATYGLMLQARRQSTFAEHAPRSEYKRTVREVDVLFVGRVGLGVLAGGRAICQPQSHHPHQQRRTQATDQGTPEQRRDPRYEPAETPPRIR